MTDRKGPAAAGRGRLLAWSALGLAALLLLLVWWWPSKSRPEAQRSTKAAESGVSTKVGPPRRRAPALVAPRPVKTAAKPIIDAVHVEKRSVCEGEENLVTVDAHSEDGSSLRYVVGGERGSSVPLRAFLEPDGSQSQQYVRVIGASDLETSVPIPHYEVRPCRPLRWAEIQLRQRPNSEAEYELTAVLKSAPGASPLQAMSFEWSFGDGSKETTSSPSTDHSYDDREQTTAYASYLIQVTAISARGERVIGRRGIELLNAAFDDLERVGHVTLVGQPTPRVPQLGADGRVTQKFRVYHVHRQSVLLDQVVVRGHTRDGDGEPVAQELDPSQVLGLDEIPAGRGVEVTLSFDAAGESALFMRSFELWGHTPDGLPATGTLTVMRPQQPPTRDNHVPVTDPELMAKIVAAQRLLDREVVSQEDIYTLERDGRLAAEMSRAPSPAQNATANLPMRNGLAVLETVPGPEPVDQP